MISGRIAGNVIAGCIRKGDTSAGALRQYDREIEQALGPALDRNYFLKEQVRRASDAKLDLLFRTAKTMGVEKFSTTAILGEIFRPRSRRAAMLAQLLSR
jgi:flavin-dependent dehydrogenase